MTNEVQIEEDKEDILFKDGHIDSPFSTKDIKITNAVISLSSIVDRLKHNEIDLNPDFQRNANLWNKKQMSRLIESIILKLPLPVFYFDVTNPDRWLVVDGLQRLSTLKKFIIEESLTLNHLEFLDTLNGEKYSKLERSLKRIIDETQIITYQIEAQTPKEVRYSIFNRINTGGLSLNSQEIRQALNQNGQGVGFLKKICDNKTFKDIVGVRTERMLDRELALRFIAFKLTSYKEFKVNNISDFLDKAMEKLDSITDENQLSILEKNLIDTLKFSEQVLGKSHRFSRSIGNNSRTKTLNRSLFDVISTCFSEILDKKKFISKKDLFLKKLKNMLRDEKGSFSKAITEGTSSKGAVVNRFDIMNELINEVLNED